MRNVGLGIVLALLAGCSELDKYWDRSPTGPRVARDTAPPAVRLLSPAGPDADHPTPVTGSDYRVVIEATDDVAVTHVVLHVGDGPAAQVPGPPWELTWDTRPLAEGVTHRLWAEAFDGAGNRAASDTVYAQAFNSGPAVALQTPADGALVLGTIPVSATVAGGAAIERVEFLAGAAVIGERVAPPWTIDLDTRTLAPGDHFLLARATASVGGVGVSPAVRVRVNNETPTVTIGFPATGHRLAPRGTLVLSGSAVDVVEGAIPSARFTWTSSLDGPIGNGPYLRKRGLSVGTHTLTARAVNAWGTEASASIDVQVLERGTYAYCRNIYGEIFRAYCLACHLPGTSEFPTSQLDLKTYAGLMRGGVTTAHESIVPCRPESSLVWNKLTAEVPWAGAPMPPRDRFQPLPQAALDKLRTWIQEGAAPDDPEACPY